MKFALSMREVLGVVVEHLRSQGMHGLVQPRYTIMFDVVRDRPVAVDPHETFVHACGTNMTTLGFPSEDLGVFVDSHGLAIVTRVANFEEM